MTGGETAKNGVKFTKNLRHHSKKQAEVLEFPIKL